MALSQEEQQAIFEESLKQKKVQQDKESNIFDRVSTATRRELPSTAETQPISTESANVQKQIAETQNKVIDQFVKTKPEVQTRMISKTAPQEVNTLIDSAPAPDNIKNAAKKIHNDPAALAKKHTEIAQKKMEGKPLGMLDTFMDSASLLIPQALGMVVGGIVGGAEGAVGAFKGAAAGHKQVTDLQDRAFQKDITKEKLGIQKKRAAMEGISGERAERRLDIQEERLQLAKEEEGRKDREAQIRQERFERQQALNEQKFGLSTTKAGQLSDKQTDDLSNIDVALSQVNQFNFKALSDTGPVEGRLRSFAESMGVESNLDFVELKAQINATLADYMKTISGSAVSEQEAERLKAILPQAKDSAPAFKAKLFRFEKQLRARMKTKVAGITKGQSLKSKSAKRFLEGNETAKDIQKTKQTVQQIKQKQVQKGLTADKLKRLKELRAKAGRN
jgi:hypothetical protein